MNLSKAELLYGFIPLAVIHKVYHILCVLYCFIEIAEYCECDIFDDTKLVYHTLEFSAVCSLPWLFLFINRKKKTIFLPEVFNFIDN
jgi:hypothetical protein